MLTNSHEIFPLAVTFSRNVFGMVDNEIWFETESIGTSGSMFRKPRIKTISRLEISLPIAWELTISFAVRRSSESVLLEASNRVWAK